MCEANTELKARFGKEKKRYFNLHSLTLQTKETVNCLLQTEINQLLTRSDRESRRRRSTRSNEEPPAEAESPFLRWRQTVKRTKLLSMCFYDVGTAYTDSQCISLTERTAENDGSAYFKTQKLFMRQLNRWEIQFLFGEKPFKVFHYPTLQPCLLDQAQSQ